MATTSTPTDPKNPGKVRTGGETVRVVHVHLNQRDVDGIMRLAEKHRYKGEGGPPPAESLESALLDVIHRISLGTV